MADGAFAELAQTAVQGFAAGWEIPVTVTHSSRYVKCQHIPLAGPRSKDTPALSHPAVPICQDASTVVLIHPVAAPYSGILHAKSRTTGAMASSSIAWTMTVIHMSAALETASRRLTLMWWC